MTSRSLDLGGQGVCDDSLQPLLRKNVAINGGGLKLTKMT